MAKEFAQKFYHSAAWHHARNAYIAKRIAVDGGMCEHCHKRNGYIVHHVIELTPDNINDPNVTLNENNFQYWCKPCHDNEHLPSHENGVMYCEFDADGNPIRRVESPPKFSAK